MTKPTLILLDLATVWDIVILAIDRHCKSVKSSLIDCSPLSRPSSQLRTADWRSGNRFRSVGHEREGCEFSHVKQSKTGSQCICSGGAGGTNLFARNGRGYESRDPFVVAGTRSFWRNISGRFDAALRRWCEQASYGKELSAKEIVGEGKVKTPEEATPLITSYRKPLRSTRFETLRGVS